MYMLKIAVIQSDIAWESPQSNYNLFEQSLNSLEVDTELVLLPETFSTGFSMSPRKLGEAYPGDTVLWMKKQALARQMAIAGSHIASVDGGFVNRLVFAHPDGTIDYYDKRHLFRMAGEDQHYRPGQKRVIIHYKGWRILPLVCYDLRFPVWSRNRNDYDLILIVANWPEKRQHAWNSLLVARAIENQCYVAACNRVGVDGNGVNHCGDSQVIDPLGTTLSRAEKNANQVISCTIVLENLTAMRKNFPAFLDADEFVIKGV